MADAPDDTTGFVPYVYYCRVRAERIVPVTARQQEAERLTREEVLRGELELLWLDVDGRAHIGLPPGFSGWYAYYDSFANCIREFPPPVSGRVLYEPQVRERQRLSPVLQQAPEPDRRTELAPYLY